MLGCLSPEHTVRSVHDPCHFVDDRSSTGKPRLSISHPLRIDHGMTVEAEGRQGSSFRPDTKSTAQCDY